MGLLDDAIREHLELKRLHGADPSEVARQEREALGSARETPAAPATDDAADLEVPRVPEADVPTPGPSAPPPEPDAIPEPPVAEEPPAPAGGAVSIDRYEPDVEWTDTRTPPPAEEPEAEAVEEDVLEETPEFLQETPEHDRLWFEQRPPRDFDF